MKILIIEDEEMIRLPLQEILELNGHTVIAAPDGPTGVALARQRPDLILCDVGLPGLDGFGVLQAVQAQPECREIPFIFLTARAGRDDQRRGMELGADDYLVKPFTERDLLKAIAARVRRQAPLRERLGQLQGERHAAMEANWSHELMTPLNGILGALQLIELEADTIRPAELRELLGIVRASAERQYWLAHKLVLYFDLESRRGKGAPAAPAEAEAAVGAAVERVGRVEQRTTDLVTRMAPGSVSADGVHLTEAVAELVENACHHAPAGQPITITGEVAGGRYRIAVCDHGPGLTAQERAAVRPFRQFGRDKGEQQGLGLGLAIARTVAELAGGTLSLEAGRGGLGLCATLDLPLVDATAA